MTQEKTQTSVASEIGQAKEMGEQSDALSQASFKLTELKLRQESIELELAAIKLEQEKERLLRLQRNSQRRPFLFWSVVGIAGLMYLGFLFEIGYGIACVFHPEWSSETLGAEERFAVVKLSLLGIIPTVLVGLLMKSVYASTPKESITVKDVVPVKVVTDSLVKSSS